VKIKQAIALVAALAVAPVVGLAGNAQAASCTTSSHCYAENQLEGNGSYPNAAGVDLEVSCLSVANRSTDFGDWEMWFETNTPQVSYDTWVEEGMTAGSLQDGHQGFMWFWADERPNGTYNEHYIRNASAGTSTNVSVYYAGSNNEDVYLGGSKIGTSTGNGSGGLYANAGAEMTTTAATVQGWANNFQYRTGSSWHWASPDVWNNSGGWISTSAGGANLYASTGCGGSLAPASAQRTTTEGTAEQSTGALLKIGQRVAVRAHESAPTNARTVRSSRQRAINTLLGGDKVGSNQPVDVVQFNGTFSPTRRIAQHKPGALPTGNTLTVLVDPATGQVTDWGISNAAPSALSALGKVSKLS
jgi:hypothetical protein